MSKTDFGSTVIYFDGRRTITGCNKDNFEILEENTMINIGTKVKVKGCTGGRSAYNGEQVTIVGHQGDMHRIIIDGSKDECDYVFAASELDEYPLTISDALLGKVLEDNQGTVLRFNKDTMVFEFKTKGRRDYTKVTEDITGKKFKEFVVTPKFSVGQIVEYDDEYARVAKVNSDMTYDITMQPSRYEIGDIVLKGKSEDELKEVL